LGSQVSDVNVQDYLEKLFEDFQERRFIPLGDMWERGLRDLFKTWMRIVPSSMKHSTPVFFPHALLTSPMTFRIRTYPNNEIFHHKGHKGHKDFSL
jgi:hypothetical protein